MSKKTFILIPAFNASETIESVLNKIPKQAYKEVNKILIINDGSIDPTESVVKKLRIKYKKIILISHKSNKGYGAAQKTGFNCALKHKADIVVLLHADGQYDPKSLNKFIEPIKQNKADIVAGSRHLGGNMLKQGMPFHKFVGNKLLNFLINSFLKQKLTSYHSGYKSYSKKTLKTLPFVHYSDYFDFDAQMLIGSVKNKLRIKEVPIKTIYGNEKSYLNSWIYGLRIIKDTIKSN